MNVLLITYSFPPAGGVGVLRALSLAKYLPEKGIHLDVLTARNAAAVGADGALVAQVPSSVTVHRTWTLDLPFAIRKGIKRAISGTVNDRGAAAHSHKARPHLLKRLVANALLPDPQVGWLVFALPAAVRIVRRRRIDLVLITVPPFSSACLVSRLRRRFPSLPIVLDFRDEWLSTTLHLVSFNSNRRAVRVASDIEAQAVRHADAIVAASEGAREEIRNRYPSAPESRFHCIPNGFDTPFQPVSPSTVPALRGQRVVLTYTGTLYGSTDPRSFIEAASRLPEHISRQLLIRFIGRIELDVYARAMETLGDNAEVKGFVPHAEALRAISESTYLLLISHDRLNISGKLYDYLGSGKPILGVIHPGGEVRRVLEETRAGWWANAQDPAAIERMLIEAVERAPMLDRTFQPDRERISAYHRRPLAHRYAELLETSCGVAR
jgi:glycosyltransferase involved in cell wall biosynthesis